jgi:hypothetical protein
VRLYHFTCRDAAPLIAEDGELRPHRQVQLDGTKLVWLTDLEAPNRYEIGLTSHILSCDRMEFRFAADVEEPLRWVDYLRDQPRDVRVAARYLAMATGAKPMHWYVSTVAVPVVSS